MDLQIGIVDFPNVGKSTIFNALTESGIPAGNYPFCTIDSNVGIVEVTDLRLNDISAVIKTKKVIPATIEFVDIAGLVRGASNGEGLGNQFLSHIRNVDAIVHVIRCFEDNNITHVEGSIDPIRDIEVIDTELLIRDIESVERRIQKSNKKARAGDKEAKVELPILEIILPQMNDGKVVRDISLDNSQKAVIKQLALLTMKPVLYVTNVDENEIASGNRGKYAQQVFELAESQQNTAIRLCGFIEMEISTMESKDREMFLSEYNLSEPGLHKLISSAYELMEYHSELKLKEAGKIRQEGKTYTVQDGDVVFFKFKV